MLHRDRDAHRSQAVAGTRPDQVGAADWLSLGDGPGSYPALECVEIILRHQVPETLEIGGNRCHSHPLGGERRSLRDGGCGNSNERRGVPVL